MAKRITITLSDDLAEAFEILRVRRKYRTPTEFVAGLVRYDADTQSDHLNSADWAALSPAERDRLDAGFLKHVKANEGVKGSRLEKRLTAVIDYITTTIAAGNVPSLEKAAAAFRKDPV